MMKIIIEGLIPINDISAEVLEHMLSYDYIKRFYEHCSHAYTEQQITNATEPIRNELRRILEAKKRAKAALLPQPKIEDRT